MLICIYLFLQKLQECCRRGFVYVLFPKRRKNLQRCRDAFSDIFSWNKEGKEANSRSCGPRSLCFDTDRNLTSILKKDQTDILRLNNKKWMNGREMNSQTSTQKRTPEHKVTEQTDGRKCRQTLQTNDKRNQTNTTAKPSYESVRKNLDSFRLSIAVKL